MSRTISHSATSRYTCYLGRDGCRTRHYACLGTAQWTDGYPSKAVIEAEMDRKGRIYHHRRKKVVGYFAFLPSPEPTYTWIYEGAWLNDEPYYVVHRLTSLPDVHGIWDDVMV